MVVGVVGLRRRLILFHVQATSSTKSAMASSIKDSNRAVKPIVTDWPFRKKQKVDSILEP